MQGVRGVGSLAAWTALLVLAASCGGGGTDAAPYAAPYAVAFAPGPIPYAVEATIHVPDPAAVVSVAFTVASSPGHLCRDVHVEYARSHLDREGKIDAAQGTVRATVFGLYADTANEVTIEVSTGAGSSYRAQHTVVTGPAPEAPLPTLAVRQADEGLPLDFMLLQGFGAPAIVDVDGEVRWRAPDVGEDLFPRALTSEGLVAGSLFSNRIYTMDWLGRFQAFALSDPRCSLSHHGIEPGRTGFLDTVSFQDGAVVRPQSVLVEMTADGVVTQLWDFDQLFGDRIQSCGEDASSLVRDGIDWFHMNSAIYDPTDDGIIASSRENFVVKIDYETGEIRWLLGNPQKSWYVDFPSSLQPLALTVLGDPPIGQHSPSLSPDGELLMLFDNGMGNLVLDDVGDTRSWSRVVVYRIDEQARTAEEVLSLDFEQSIFAPYCSSARWTEAGNVLVVFTSPVHLPATRILVVDAAGDVRFDAEIEVVQSGFAYSAEEIRLQDLRLE